jgi:CRP-like cAMP-binding protein
MDKDTALSFLAKVPVFNGLTAADFALLLGLAEERSFAVAEVLIAEGQVAPPFQILVDGEVSVMLPRISPSSGVDRGADVPLNHLSKGRCFGEYSLLDEMQASASVVAATPGTVLTIPHSALLNLLASDDRIGRTVYRNMLTELVGRLKRRESQFDARAVVSP